MNHYIGEIKGDRNFSAPTKFVPKSEQDSDLEKRLRRRLCRKRARSTIMEDNPAHDYSNCKATRLILETLGCMSQDLILFTDCTY